MFTSFVNSLGWSLIHSLWQAAIIYLVLQLLLKYLKNAPAKVRYMLSAIAMAGIFISFLLTFYHQWENTYSVNTITTTVSTTIASGDTSFLSYIPTNAIAEPLSGEWLIYLVGLYALGLLFFFGKVIHDLYIMQKIRHHRRFPFDPAWEKYLAKLANAWQISKNVGLYLSEKIDVPVVIGYFKPVIYLPFSIVNNLSPEQIETILLHELAHIKRADFLVNIIQTIVETLLFFNPFIWLLSRNMRRERELACDEWVIAEKEPKIYAESLLALEENRWNKGKFALAAATKKQQLFQRIKNMMEMKKKKLNITQKLLVAVFIIGSIISISWLVPEKKTEHQADNSQNIIPARSSGQTSDTIPHLPNPPKVMGVAVVSTPPAPPTIGLNTLPDPPDLPAPPPAPAAIDSIPGNLDSIISSATSNMRQYFNSEEWKHYKQSLKNYATSVQQYFQSKEWQQQQEALKQQAQALKQQMKSKEWQQKMDSFRTAISKVRPDIDSILSQVKNKVTFAQDSSIIVWNNGHKNVRVNHLINRMQQDGLIQDNENYKIRLDDNGLFINGKKQPERYYKKYRSLIGDHTKIKIKKDNDSYSSSISTSD